MILRVRLICCWWVLITLTASANETPTPNVILLMSDEDDNRPTKLFFGYRRLRGDIDGQAIISRNWKLLREARPEGRVRLYNLADDPYEKNDLAEAKTERLLELRERMKAIDDEYQLSRDGAEYRY